VPNGDLSVDDAIELFKNKPQEEQFALIYRMFHNQNCTCQNRPAECEAKFIAKSWLKTKVAILTGFGLGVGLGIDKMFEHIPNLLKLLGN